MALYPPCDLVPSANEKIATQLDISILDFLQNSYSTVSNIYLDNSKNVSLTDILLSPTHFNLRDYLLLDVLLVSCKHNMLCYETKVIANRIAAITNVAKVDNRAGWRGAGVQ